MAIEKLLNILLIFLESISGETKNKSGIIRYDNFWVNPWYDLFKLIDQNKEATAKI